MATSTIPRNLDQKPQKKINWAKRTRELLAEALDGSVLKLIDGGLSGLEGSPNLSSLIEDEEVKEDRDRFLALLGGIEDRAKNLTEKEHEEICQRTIELEKMYYMRLHLGADKMAELLIRFYLQAHWNLSELGTGSSRITPQEDEQEGEAVISRPAAIHPEADKPTGYTITEEEFKKLQEIHGQLIGLSEIVDHVDTYSAVSILLGPIVKNFDTVSPKKVGGAA